LALCKLQTQPSVKLADDGEVATDQEKAFSSVFTKEDTPNKSVAGDVYSGSPISEYLMILCLESYSGYK